MQDVPGLGYKSDLVRVKPGYASNYLLPRGLALLATAAQKKVAAEAALQGAKKALRNKEAAEILAEKLEALSLKLVAQTAQEGKLFGAVTAHQVAAMLQEAHQIRLDPKAIELPEPMKALGSYPVRFALHKEVVVAATLQVVAK